MNKEFAMYKFLKFTSFLLVVIGAINWGFIGWFGFDLVASIFGDMSVLSRIVYALVGLAGLIAPVVWIMHQSRCYCEDD